MADGGSAGSAFFAAALGALVAVGGSAFVIYNMTSTQRTQFEAKLAAIDSKLDKTNAAIADSKTADTGTDGAQTAASLDGIKNTLGRVDERINQLTASVASMERAMSASAQAFNDDKAQQKKQNTAFEKIDGEVMGLKAALAAQKQTLDEIANSARKSTSQTMAATNSDPAIAERELVVVYVPQAGAGAAETTGSITPAPLSVRFEKIGAVNPQGQIDAIAANLKKIIQDKHGCTISVAGYADTLGGDKVNLEISRQRAEAVAARLRSALAGQDVKIEKVGWGERQLKVWTPDGQGEKANRRVDIGVECTS